MPTIDRRIDAYIADASDFAKPILLHLRDLVHRACPDVEETFKWSFPHFMHKGIICSMAAFKNHCTFGFWKWGLIAKKVQVAAVEKEGAMGRFGRITRLSDLPSDRVLLACIKEAARLNDEGIKLPSKSKPKEKKTLVVPDCLLSALSKNKKASETFNGFSYSHKKEYVEWIDEAKTEETRAKRLEKTLQWLTEGKSRHWKYQNC